MMNRRSLILGLSAALAAPAIVRAGSLMKIAVLRDSWRVSGFLTDEYAWSMNLSEASLLRVLRETYDASVMWSYPSKTMKLFGKPKFIDLTRTAHAL